MKLHIWHKKPEVTFEVCGVKVPVFKSLCGLTKGKNWDREADGLCLKCMPEVKGSK